MHIRFYLPVYIQHQNNKVFSYQVIAYKYEILKIFNFHNCSIQIEYM